MAIRGDYSQGQQITRKDERCDFVDFWPRRYIKPVVDRGKEVVSTFSTEKEFRRTIDAQMQLETLVSSRTRMDLLISKYMMLRDEDRRHCEFPDLFAVDSIDEAANGNARMLILRLGQGKVRSQAQIGF